jgi:DNA-binding FadR family transcriptional regulator
MAATRTKRPGAMPPRVRRVVDELTRRINQGRLRPGDQLPTLRELCRAFDVSYGVIHQALQRLEQDGLVHKLHGSGTYVKDRRATTTSGPALPRKARSDVYILMHAMRAEFFTPLASLVCAIQDRGFIPIPWCSIGSSPSRSSD